jgi:hypothetical protein
MHASARQERGRWLPRSWLLAIGLIALLPASCGDGSEEAGTTGVTTGVRGVVAVSPSCAAVAVGETCPEIRVPEARVVVRAPGADRARGVSTSGAVVASVTAGKDGAFSLPLPPGEYVVVAEGQAIPRCDAVTVRVPTTGYADVHLLCDSGIR